MKLVFPFLLALLVWSAPGWSQTAEEVQVQMEQFVAEHLDEPLLNEPMHLASYYQKLSLEERAQFSEGAAQQAVRRNYWKRVFMEKHADWFPEEINTDIALLNESAIPNPDLTSDCPLNIVVIVDRSGSLIFLGQRIRDELNAFVSNLVGSNSTVTFVGMGNSNATASVSATLTYSGGQTGSQHNAFINGIPFGGVTDDFDRWSSGFTAAAGLGADLIYVITGDNDGHGANEAGGIMNRADDLKAEGSHIFILAIPPGNNYIGGSIPASVALATNDNPDETDVISLDAVGSNDFHTLGGTIATFGLDISEWLSVSTTGASVTDVSPSNCVSNEVIISGTYSSCNHVPILVGLLQFSQDGDVISSFPISINSDGTFTAELEISDLINLGMEHGNWYDVAPFFLLADGTVINGGQFNIGVNDDFFIADQSDPQVILNSEESDVATSQTVFCEGDPIFYHGFDPLSGNDHFNSIRRRPIGSTGPFTEYRKYDADGKVGVSLDGYAEDLQDIYPANSDYPDGYLVAGYEYQLQIATWNNALCITWSDVYPEFQIIDCCMATASIAKVPECVLPGDPFTILVTVNAPISPDAIEEIYSGSSDYTIIDREVVLVDGVLTIFLTVVANTCSCEGQMLIFDIRHSGCSDPIWLMTDPIPCCMNDCEAVRIVDWEASEECLIVNNQPARSFCIEVFSEEGDVLDAFGVSNTTTCQVDLINLVVTPIAPDGHFTICGYLLFEDEDCTGHADVSLNVETERTCCKIEQSFSFPGGCDLIDACLEGGAAVEILLASQDPALLSVSLGLDLGSVVTVTDYINGGQFDLTVTTATCGPFTLDPGGNIGGGQGCNGLLIPVPSYVDCTEEVPSFLYDFEIQYGKCTWRIIGDYCTTLTMTKGVKEKGEERTIEKTSDPVLHTSVSIVPNPMMAYSPITFHFSDTNTPAKITLVDQMGKMVERINPAQDQLTYQHHLAAPLPGGLYFLLMEYPDGSVQSHKLVVLP